VKYCCGQTPDSVLYQHHVDSVNNVFSVLLNITEAVAACNEQHFKNASCLIYTVHVSCKNIKNIFYKKCELILMRCAKAYSSSGSVV